MSEVLFYRKNLVNINTLFVFSNKSILYEIIACFLSMSSIIYEKYLTLTATIS